MGNELRRLRCAGFVTATAKRLEPVARWHARACTSLNGLGDDTASVGRQRAGILAVRTSVHRAREPGGERLTKAFEAGRRESEEAGAVIGVVERNDAALAGGEQRCSQCDLDSVGTGDPELRGPRQTLSKLRGDRGVRKIAERMCDGSRGDRRHHVRIAMTESGNAEAAGQVEILAPVRVPDAAALGPGPDQAPLRPISRPSVSAAM